MAINEFLKRQAVEYRENVGNLNNAAAILTEANKNGANIFINFNGVKLYSCETKTVDDVYLQYHGETKDEFEANLQAARAERQERQMKLKQERIENIPDLIERGNKVILPGLEKEWAEYVRTDAVSEYGGLAKETLKILEAIHAGNMDKAMQIINYGGHSGASHSIVANTVLSFSDEKGIEFYKLVYPDRAHVKSVAERFEHQGAFASAMKGAYDDKEMKEYLLTQAVRTASWIKDANIDKLLTPETREQLDAMIEAQRGKFGNTFEVVGNKEDGFVLQDFYYSSEISNIRIPIDIDSISLGSIASAIENAMQAHYDYKRFFKRDGMSIEDTLASTITTAHIVAKTEAEKDIQNSIANDVLDERKDNEEKTENGSEIENKEIENSDSKTNSKDFNTQDRDEFGDEDR